MSVSDDVSFKHHNAEESLPRLHSDSVHNFSISVTSPPLTVPFLPSPAAQSYGGDGRGVGERIKEGGGCGWVSGDAADPDLHLTRTGGGHRLCDGGEG